MTRQLSTFSNSAAIEKVSRKMDFGGRVLLQSTAQITGSGSFSLVKAMGYDQADRLKFVGHKLFETGILKKAYTHSINA